MNQIDNAHCRDWAYLSSLLAPSRLPLPYSTFHFILLAGITIIIIIFMLLLLIAGMIIIIMMVIIIINMKKMITRS